MNGQRASGSPPLRLGSGDFVKLGKSCAQRASGSPPLRLGSGDFVKLGKSCALALAGVVLSAAVVYAGNLEGTSYAWLVPLATVGINALRKFVTDTLD